MDLVEIPTVNEEEKEEEGNSITVDLMEEEEEEEEEERFDVGALVERKEEEEIEKNDSALLDEIDQDEVEKDEENLNSIESMNEEEKEEEEGRNQEVSSNLDERIEMKGNEEEDEEEEEEGGEEEEKEEEETDENSNNGEEEKEEEEHDELVQEKEQVENGNEEEDEEEEEKEGEEREEKEEEGEEEENEEEENEISKNGEEEKEEEEPAVLVEEKEEREMENEKEKEIDEINKGDVEEERKEESTGESSVSEKSMEEEKEEGEEAGVKQENLSADQEAEKSPSEIIIIDDEEDILPLGASITSSTSSLASKGVLQSSDSGKRKVTSVRELPLDFFSRCPDLLSMKKAYIYTTMKLSNGSLLFLFSLEYGQLLSPCTSCTCSKGKPSKPAVPGLTLSRLWEERKHFLDEHGLTNAEIDHIQKILSGSQSEEEEELVPTDGIIEYDDFRRLGRALFQTPILLPIGEGSPVTIEFFEATEKQDAYLIYFCGCGTTQGSGEKWSLTSLKKSFSHFSRAHGISLDIFYHFRHFFSHSYRDNVSRQAVSLIPANDTRKRGKKSDQEEGVAAQGEAKGKEPGKVNEEIGMEKGEESELKKEEISEKAKKIVESLKKEMAKKQQGTAAAAADQQQQSLIEKEREKKRKLGQTSVASSIAAAAAAVGSGQFIKQKEAKKQKKRNSAVEAAAPLLSSMKEMVFNQPLRVPLRSEASNSYIELMFVLHKSKKPKVLCKTLSGLNVGRCSKLCHREAIEYFYNHLRDEHGVTNESITRIRELKKEFDAKSAPPKEKEREKKEVEKEAAVVVQKPVSESRIIDLTFLSTDLTSNRTFTLRSLNHRDVNLTLFPKERKVKCENCKSFTCSFDELFQLNESNHFISFHLIPSQSLFKLLTILCDDEGESSLLEKEKINKLERENQRLAKELTDTKAELRVATSSNERMLKMLVEKTSEHTKEVINLKKHLKKERKARK